MSVSPFLYLFEIAIESAGSNFKTKITVGVQISKNRERSLKRNGVARPNFPQNGTDRFLFLLARRHVLVDTELYVHVQCSQFQQLEVSAIVPRMDFGINLLLVPERLRVLNPVVFIFFLGSKSASTDWLRNNNRDVASRRKLAPRRRGRVVRALDSRPESPEFGSHSQQFEIQGHAL